MEVAFKWRCRFSMLVCFLAATCMDISLGTEPGLLDRSPADFLASLVEADSKIMAEESSGKVNEPLPNSHDSISSKTLPMGLSDSMGGLGKLQDSMPMGFGGSMMGGLGKFHDSKSMPMGLGGPMMGGAGKTGQVLKMAALPVKKAMVKKAVAAKVVVPKLALPIAALKKKPKVHSLKPIVHVIHKPVPVFHKVPVPKKVLVPKFYPVLKPIPVPKKVWVPYKVPVFKIIPKIVKIPKAIPVPKFIPVKKPIPFGIPIPVPKFHKVPVPKLVPYKKYIPIPIPKKVPKFYPVPVKKIIKVPKPYYVPIKVPHFSASYMKTPMMVDVPDVKKTPFKGMTGKKPSMMHLIPSGNMDAFKFLDSNMGKNSNLDLFGGGKKD